MPVTCFYDASCTACLLQRTHALARARMFLYGDFAFALVFKLYVTKLYVRPLGLHSRSHIRRCDFVILFIKQSGKKIRITFGVGLYLNIFYTYTDTHAHTFIIDMYVNLSLIHI